MIINKHEEKIIPVLRKIFGQMERSVAIDFYQGERPFTREYLSRFFKVFGQIDIVKVVPPKGGKLCYITFKSKKVAKKLSSHRIVLFG
jgi:hypothetical protein